MKKRYLALIFLASIPAYSGPNISNITIPFSVPKHSMRLGADKEGTSPQQDIVSISGDKLSGLIKSVRKSICHKKEKIGIRFWIKGDASLNVSIASSDIESGLEVTIQCD